MSHRGTEWTEDFKTKLWKSQRHRRCIERRSLFANAISNLYTKRLPQNSYQESVRYTSVVLCAVGTSLTLRLPPVPSVTPCAYDIRLLVYHSIFRKNSFICKLLVSDKTFFCVHIFLIQNNKKNGLIVLHIQPFLFPL